MKVSIIILAAGMSRRTKGNKLLYKIDGDMTVIEKVVSTAIESKAGPVIVVTGHEASKINETIKHFQEIIITVFNSEHEKGMSSSVKTGAEKALELYPSLPLMVIPGDCPLIEVDDITKVISAYHADRKPVTVASYRGRKGHPVLFSNGLSGEILAVNEETTGLKAVTRKYGVFLVETGNRGVLMDFDTEEDFRQ